MDWFKRLLGGGSPAVPNAVPTPPSPARPRAPGPSPREAQEAMATAMATLSFGREDPWGGRRQNPTRGSARWVPPGEAAQVGTKTIPGGMIYVGGFMPADLTGGPAASVPAPCLVNPALEVARRFDPSRMGLSYYPSYSDITPDARLGYLAWLAGPRDDRNAPMGFVFLYYYGLERRLLADGPPAAERAILVEEVRRLGRVYGGGPASNSLWNYASRLLAHLRWRETMERPAPVYVPPPPPRALNNEREMPLDMRIAVARKVVAGEPLDRDLAISAFLHLPAHQGGAPQRIPMERTREEFLALLRLRFDAKFPKGFRMRDRKDSALSVVYNPASMHFVVPPMAGGATRLPDPTRLEWNRMRLFVQKAVDDLGPYAKAVGSDGARAGTPETLALLPPELLDTRFGAPLAPLREWLGTLTDGQRVPAAELARRCLGTAETGAKQGKAASGVLGRLGWLVEPDPPFGRAGGDADADAVLFRPLDVGDLAAPPGRELPLGLLLVSVLSALLGPGNAAGVERGADEIAALVSLGPVAGRRLRMRARWLDGRPMAKAAAKRLVSALPPDGIETAARLSIALATTRGLSEPRHVAVLETVMDALAVPRERVYGAFHRAAVLGHHPAVRALPVTPPRPGEPVTVETSSGAPRGHRIPMPSPAVAGLSGAVLSPVSRVPARTPSAAGQAPPPSIVSPEPAVPDGPAPLDFAAIEAIRRDTEEASRALAAVWAEDEPEPQAPQAAAAAPDAAEGGDSGDGAPPPGFGGLDAAHARLAVALSARDEWPRGDYDGEARAQGLMPDGAAETINEWALDRFDEAVIEDGDPLEVNVALLRACMDGMTG